MLRMRQTFIVGRKNVTGTACCPMSQYMNRKGMPDVREIGCVAGACVLRCQECAT